MLWISIRRKRNDVSFLNYVHGKGLGSSQLASSTALLQLEAVAKGLSFSQVEPEPGA